MSEMRSSPFGYQPALDGVRALAVTAVVLYHTGVPGVDGGFLGVDAFFVLSGYLITSLLLAERARDGRIRLGRFWTRRARRLLPALLAVLVATVVAGHFLLDPDALGLLRADAFAALGYAANWRMIFRGTGYAAATATASPLQHTWSLGIEEQFYLLWPLVVAGLTARLAARRARRALIALCCAGAAASAVLCALLYRPAVIARAYYGTDTRAQALLVGAALAGILAVPRAGAAWRPLRVLGPAGLLGTLVLWHFAGDQAAWLYRGGLAVAALAVAAVLTAVVTGPRTLLARLLAVAPLAALGRVSYGVYLWHWPICIFVTADATGLSRWPLLAVRLAATMAAALLSYHLIEQPIRHGALGRRLPRRLPAAITTTALGCTILTIGLATAAAAALAPAAAPAPVIVTLPSPRPTSAASTAGPPRTPRIVRGRVPRVTFFGDSVSWVIGDYLPPHPGIITTDRAIQGCGIATLPRILELGTPHTNYPGCTNWPARWRAGVNADNPDVSVVELNRWELMDRFYQGGYQHVGEPGYDAYLLAQLDRAVSIAGSRGASVVLLTAAYTHRAERPDGSLYPEDQPARVNAWNSLLRVEAARRPGQVTILNLNRVVCPGGVFTWNVDGLRIRSDGLHYTPAGVQRIIAPWLLPRLAEVAAGA
jgi:peptidoglycan/LPS O-acetylase OafA/YrhL